MPFLILAAHAHARDWPSDAAAFQGEWRRDGLALGIVLAICAVAWIVVEADLRRALRAIGIAAAGTLLAGLITAFVLAGVGLLY